MPGIYNTMFTIIIMWFKQAYRQGIKYPQYFFLLYGWYAANWWVGSPEDDRMYGCTAEERQSVLPYSLAPLTAEFISDYSQQADTGIV